MQDITAELEKLIGGYQGQMTTLAREAGVDRSTLYKFAKGERVPNGEQLYRLVHALNLPPERTADLIMRGNALRGSSEPVMRSEIELLLNTLFAMPPRLEKVRAMPIRPDPTEPLPLCGFVYGAVETEKMAQRLMREYLRGDDVRPVLVSPVCTAPLLNGALRGLAQWRGKPHAVRQLLRLGSPGESVAGDAGNIRAVTRAVPFLFIDNVNYEARSMVSPAVENLPGTLADAYLLFPHAALLCAGDSAALVTEPAVVEGFREVYEKQYRDAVPFLQPTEWGHDFAEAAELYDGFFQRNDGAILVRWRPPLALFLDDAMCEQIQLTPEMDNDGVRSMVLEYIRKWKNRRMNVIFSEAGLLDFVHSGRIGGLPDDLYLPLTPQLRRNLLLHLREAVEKEEPMVCLADPERQPMVPGIHVVILDGGGVVFCRTAAGAANEPCRREYLVQQPLLTRSMAEYLRWLQTDGRLRSKKYTLDFIDSCLQML